MALHITSTERELLSQMRAAKVPMAQIAKALGRAPSTLFREVQRNQAPEGYRPLEAQRKADARRKRRPRKMDDPKIRDYVQKGLCNRWSPDQIDGRSRRQFLDDEHCWISRQTIYNWINRAENASPWKRYLRFYRRRKRRHKGLLTSPPMKDRPALINDRERYGDWEGDTVVGPRQKGSAPVLVTLVERGSGYLEMARVENRRATTVNRALRKRLKRHSPNWCHSLTVDHGTEFALVFELNRQLNLETYYCEPGCPWQKGTNENTNGLIRQFFKKGTSFRNIHPDQIEKVQNLINNRPRKRLGYETPSELLARHASDAIEI